MQLGFDIIIINSLAAEGWFHQQLLGTSYFWPFSKNSSRLIKFQNFLSFAHKKPNTVSYNIFQTEIKKVCSFFCKKYLKKTKKLPFEKNLGWPCWPDVDGSNLDNSPIILV